MNIVIRQLLKEGKIIFQDTLFLLPSVVVILYMHYRVCSSAVVELGIASQLHGFASTIFDILTLALLAFILTGMRKIATIIIVTLISSTWSFSNVIYAYYFRAYIPISVIGQVEGLRHLTLWDYFINAIYITDLVYVAAIVFVIYIALYGKQDFGNRDKKRYLIFLLTPFIIIALLFLCSKLFFFEGRLTIPNAETIKQTSLMPTRKRIGVLPVGTVAEYGVFRAVVYPKIFMQDINRQLTRNQSHRIERYIQSSDVLYSDSITATTLSKRQNVIFILAESYLADTRDKYFGGKEVTPFLDEVRKEAGTVFNDSVYPNVTLGNSSDGQFIYMTGLLPHRQELTVALLSEHVFPSLAYLLKKLSYKTLMTIPTESQVWSQEEACRAYAIDSLYSTSILKTTAWLNDEELFDFALRNERKVTEPYFHVILTSSTHGAYNELSAGCGKCDCCPTHFPADYTQDYINYLKACHFMDHAIRRYIEQKPDALIIIASDHGWAENKGLLPKGVDGDRISLLIKKSGYNGESYGDRINQLDVFTSIVDLLQPYKDIGWHGKIRWYGLGNSIFHPQGWTTSVTENKWDMSTDIIEGNYFTPLLNTGKK